MTKAVMYELASVQHSDQLLVEGEGAVSARCPGVQLQNWHILGLISCQPIHAYFLIINTSKPRLCIHSFSFLEYALIKNRLVGWESERSKHLHNSTWISLSGERDE